MLGWFTPLIRTSQFLWLPRSEFLMDCDGATMVGAMGICQAKPTQNDEALSWHSCSYPAKEDVNPCNCFTSGIQTWTAKTGLSPSKGDFGRHNFNDFLHFSICFLLDVAIIGVTLGRFLGSATGPGKASGLASWWAGASIEGRRPWQGGHMVFLETIYISTTKEFC